MMWLAAMALGALGFLAFMTQRRRGQQPDPGWMSQQWLAEHRAGAR